MPDVRSFQLYLLSFMRATARVEAAQRALGASHAEMAAARERMLSAGLQTPGDRVDLYVALLGPGFERAKHQSSDPYKVESLRFRLPLWDTLDWVVYGSADGIAGEARFERWANGTRPLQSTADLKVWQVVEDDLLASDWELEVGDEWYPMKDFVGSDRSGRRIALCFDFGLLQKVEALHRSQVGSEQG